MIDIDTEKPHDYCGVFGVFSPKADAARLTYFGLLSLQHRGQESSGIVVSHKQKLQIHKGMGLVSQVFSESDIASLVGSLAIGHNRYSTAGFSNIKNAQPSLYNSKYGDIALAHNGNLANYQDLKSWLLKKGHCFNTDVDAELLIRLVIESNGRNLKTKLINALPLVKGAFSLIFICKDKLYAVRDQWGIRPLVLGKINGKGWVVASESVAIESVGGKVLREVKAGEFIEISKKGINSFHQIKNKKGGFCIFEYVYFARPDSVMNKQLIYIARSNSGKILAKEYPVKADLVMSVPDSGTASALGYSQVSKIPFHEGLIKSRYVGRTFIQPSQQIRHMGVRLKFSPLKEILKDKRVVLIDDSIVRGTTINKIIKMLRKSGCKEIHLRIASPPFKHPCFLGVDVARYNSLIASDNKLGNDLEKIREKVGADSLEYLSLKSLKKAIGKVDCKFCTGCFNGQYPVNK